MAAPAADPCPRPGQGYAGQVRHYIADLKPSFPEHGSYSAATALTEANYRMVLQGLRLNVGVDGIRLPIVPSYAEATDYPPLYGEITATARSLGLLIYASPLSVGMQAYAGWSDVRYADWLASYAQAFRPDVLSPFNEAGIGDARIASIVTSLRARLTSAVALAGPDRQHVGKTADDLGHNPGLVSLFDVVDSHNADRDGSATVANWSRLVGAVGGSRPRLVVREPRRLESRPKPRPPGSRPGRSGWGPRHRDLDGQAEPRRRRRPTDSEGLRHRGPPDGPLRPGVAPRADAPVRTTVRG